MPDNEPELSEQTKLEMEAGRKIALANAAAFEKAQRLRAAEAEAEEALKKEQLNEKEAATAAAKPLKKRGD